jgi:molecular chaperone DnaK (HSP70)
MAKNDCELPSCCSALHSLNKNIYLSIGDAAKNAFHQNPKNTVFDAKRLIGRKMDESSVKQDLKHLPYTVKNKNNSPVISVKYKDESRDFVRFLFCLKVKFY